jgi:hypothetical protein
MAESTGGPTRQDTYRLTVLIEDPGTGNMVNHGVWDKMSGGEIDSDDNKYYPGGMEPPVSLGGRRTVGNVTVSRLYRLARDHDKVHKMIHAVGRSDIVINKQPMDLNGNVYGHPLVYRGKLKRCTPPDVDSEGSSAGLIEIEATIDGFPTHAGS